MIYADVKLKIEKGETICDSLIVLYRGDKNVQIRFELVNNKFVVKENTFAQLIIRRPSATSLFSEISPISDGKVILTIGEDMIDEMKEIGEYAFQIRLYDDELNARATLPPCYNGICIERPIAIEGESVVNYSRINDAIIIAGEYSDEDIFDDANDYIKTEWVDGDIISDVRMNKIEEALYEINKKSGSGTGGTSAYISTSISENVMVRTEEDFELLIDFSSPNIGKGTLKVFVNDTEAVSIKIDQGESSTMVPFSNFVKGNNTVVVYVVDRVGVMSNSLTFYLRYGGTELVSSFDPYSSYEYGNTIRYYFTPSALDTSKDLYFYMSIDGSTQPVVTCKSDERSYFTFPKSLSVGVHKCEAYVTDGDIDSNKHIFNLIIIDETSIAIATDTYTATIEEGEQLSIDYKVYSKHHNSFIIKIYVDNNLVNTGTCGLAMNYYKTSSLKEGPHTIRIEAWTNDESVYGYCISEVEITMSLFEMYKPVNAGSVFIATAQNKSNADENRDKWIGVNQDGETIEAVLNEFVFDTNDGWGNDLLTLNGTANVVIPIQPLKNNALYGFTLDITFKSKQIGIPEAEVLTIWDYEKDCGIKITSEEFILKSAGGSICDLYFADDEMTNVMFVIDREQKMAKIYLNGVMCEAFTLSDYENNGIKYLEDFATDSNIHINKFGGYCQIKEIRVYEVALGTNEILNNFISTKSTKAEQQYLEEFQKGNTLPTLTIYCDFSGLGKDDKKPCNIVYNSPDPTLYGESFTLEHKTSQLQYQGTSSMAYPIKNYRLNLRDKDGNKWKYNPFSSGQPEARFTLKADFMASGHWQNTGLAKWINDNLYHYNPKDEKSMNPAKWYDLQHGIPMTAHRESINGFPCRLILINDGTTPLNAGQYEPTPGNTKDMGVFNFNNDKDNTDTLGFDSDIFPYCASYEVTANSDTSAGAFMAYEQGIHSEMVHEGEGGVSVQADNICNRHKVTINEIDGKTNISGSVGIKQKDGTYNVSIIVSNAPMVFGKGGKR